MRKGRAKPRIVHFVQVSHEHLHLTEVQCRQPASARAGELAFDAADSAVRAAVPAGMAELAVNPLAHPLLKLMLPQLKSLMHDSALRVRVGMATLLEVIA